MARRRFVPMAGLIFGVIFAGYLAQVQLPIQPVHATAAENVTGWLWNDAVGWVSLNDTNTGACPSGTCGTYGVKVDPITTELTGFGWNDTVGWICFGASCKIAACQGSNPPTGAPGSTFAQIQPIFGNTKVAGWAKLCNEPASRGWFSLSCVNQGTCSTSDYSVIFNPTLNGSYKRFGAIDPDLTTPPTYSSFSWNKNGDGTGLGWMEFSRMLVKVSPENCYDGANADEDLNGGANCGDLSACGSLPACAENTQLKCSNTVDDDGDALVDCRDPDCSATAYCVEAKTNRDTCSNGYDDNNNSVTDCAEAACVGAFGCPLVGEPSFPVIAPLLPSDPNDVKADQLCSNGVDDDGTNGADCADINCQYQAPTCNKAWLQFKYGNVYSGRDISGTEHLGNLPNATYCLSAALNISGFTSQVGCTEAGQSTGLSLPTGSESYKSKLGNLDVDGILLGKYGKVQMNPVILPTDLGGRVYVVEGDFTINSAITFSNASGLSSRGSGLLVVKGGNLTINKNLDYAPPAGVNIVRNLASFGVLVLKNGNAAKGNILIDGAVTKIVGAYFAEGEVKTCATGACNTFLDVFGLMAARQFNFGRTTGSPVRGAEVITFDGRAVLNPPPGMQDVSKSLPSIKDSF